MFRPRSPRYPMLQTYLASRPTASLIRPVDRTGLTIAAGSLAGLSAILASLHAWPILPLLGAAGAGVFGIQAFRARPPLPPTPEQELAKQADAVVGELKQYAYLHRAFHPAVGATLEECATYAARVQAALGQDDWDHRGELRSNALAAVKVAMDEAIVHVGATLAFNRPTRPMEHVSDALEDVGFSPIVRSEREQEPLPPSFRPVRELAERLRELAERSETAATQRTVSGDEPISAAFRHLDATLGEMRRIEEAETELRTEA